jgi:integrase
MTRARRHQEGYLFTRGDFWYLRYYEPTRQADGSVLTVQRTHQLVRRDGAYRTKKAARVLADEFLKPFNDGTFTIDSTSSIVHFVEASYLPHVESRKRPSTYRGYQNMWNRYLKSRVDAPLRDFRTVDGEHLLEEIARDDDLSITTLAHVKSFLSGVFRYARRQGILNSENPMRDVVLPRARPSGETYAYSLEEILQMLKVLPEPASTIVAVAGFAGVREGELRGLLWENYDGAQLSITRSVWRSHILNPKTKASMAPVPVIAQLREKLDHHRLLAGNPQSGPIFPNSAGNPTSLAKIAHDVIRPELEKANLTWHGWHAFRRGLATNLHRLGVADKVIQAILRHSNVAVTQACYIKTATVDAIEAMRSLEYAAKHATNTAKHATNMHQFPLLTHRIM